MYSHGWLARSHAVLVRDQRVTRGVRLRERVVGRLLDVLPQLLGGRRRHVLARGALEELVLERVHERADLLADRLAKVVGLGDREAGELARDPHVLLLVDADPVGVVQDPLEPRVDVGDTLLAGFPLPVAGDVAHRPRPVEGDESDQVLELGRLDLPQRLAHPRRLELEDACGVALREHGVRLLVVERDRGDVEPREQRAGLVDHVEVAQAEEVHLEEAERLDVLHRELGHDFLVGALLLQGDDVDQRLGSDHDPGGVDRVGPRQSFER